MKIFVHISINDLVAHTLNILLAYELPHYAQYVVLFEVQGFLLRPNKTISVFRVTGLKI